MDLHEIESRRAQWIERIDGATTPAALEALRIECLGRKGGEITNLMKVIPTLAPAERGPFGQAVNQLKTAVTERLDARKAALETVRPKAASGVDVTMPGRPLGLGRPHPITQATREMVEIFARLGFEVVDGPEVEDEWHNFVGLNIPLAHPARDPLDNYYLGDHTLLRTQTSTVQIRIMEKRKPPLRIIAPGRVYRDRKSVV
jgi:phenylalanyl-tRNA synthetase alpha chain